MDIFNNDILDLKDKKLSDNLSQVLSILVYLNKHS